MVAAIAVEKTFNKKTGPVSVTMASQASCPKDCSFLGAGCYAETGYSGITTHRLNKSHKKSPESIAKEEAKAISKLSGERPLRLHVVGDCSTEGAAKILSDSVKNYPQPVWSYTHAWRNVKRKAWGNVSILASCETTKHVKQAKKADYATAMVVSKFQSDKAYVVDGVKLIPCPAQTGKSENCSSCKLCWNDGILKCINATIAFEAHGISVKKIQERLIQIQ